jgi:hypothetical protein
MFLSDILWILGMYLVLQVRSACSELGLVVAIFPPSASLELRHSEDKVDL